MTGSPASMDFVEFALMAAVSAILCAVFIVALRPLLTRYALARPNARSSHREPTPQGGGIAVVAAITLVFAVIEIFAPGILVDAPRLAPVFAAILGVAAIGAIDDIRPMDALPRLSWQAMAAFVVMAALPAELRIFAELSWWFERALILLGILWFVNLVNFMDGLDWMVVAEVVPVSAALVIVGMLGGLPNDATVVAVALFGAIVGFAPFNRPVARLFLGDVGSLPIGLLLGWLLVLVAGGGHIVAAILLPLVFIADATLTLLRRTLMGESIMQAHRSHFYQRATDGGFSVIAIVGQVFAVNILLAALALTTFMTPSRIAHIAALAAGCVVVAALLWRFARGKRS
jgi:UDP-N-acetylmuramyl pentapeptide phosphotransferase/UDP-N-acetylglucosamine-1-phosphate transferase